MSLEPEGGPWSIYPLEDGDELLDAHNDIILKFPLDIGPKIKRIIVRAPEMAALLENVVNYLDERFLVAPDEESLVHCADIRSLLKLIEEEEAR